MNRVFAARFKSSLTSCAQVYNKLGDRADSDGVELSITYLEIYQNAAYDLLNASSGANARLPKISVVDERPGTSSGEKNCK